ncbi:hypothetical protein [Streptomyces sp. NBC_00996]|uniref:hypothetical protein n=1 Tax=Streptomyces sp. NBC_00996 TaxID=2903710 RepID=UPI003865FC06|nr:hypothetical protein OG390_40735 [Streptomyces sp. NBC_00996]
MPRSTAGTIPPTQTTSSATPRTRIPPKLVRRRTHRGAQPHSEATAKGNTNTDQPADQSHTNTARTPYL